MGSQKTQEVGEERGEFIYTRLQPLRAPAPVAQRVKNPPAMDSCNGDLGLIPGLGRSLEEGMATHSSILAWRIPRDSGAWKAVTVTHGVTESWTRLSD